MHKLSGAEDLIQSRIDEGNKPIELTGKYEESERFGGKIFRIKLENIEFIMLKIVLKTNEDTPMIIFSIIFYQYLFPIFFVKLP